MHHKVERSDQFCMQTIVRNHRGPTPDEKSHQVKGKTLQPAFAMVIMTTMTTLFHLRQPGNKEHSICCRFHLGYCIYSFLTFDTTGFAWVYESSRTGAALSTNSSNFCRSKIKRSMSCSCVSLIIVLVHKCYITLRD